MLTDAHGRRQENSKYVSVLVNYSYLADGTKVSALRSDGSGLAYLGSLTYTCAGGSPASLEGVTFPGGRFVATTDDAGTTTMTPMLYASASWLTIDPLANKYYSISPYAFCANNPINYLDPDGLDIVIKGKNNSSIVVFTPNCNLQFDLSRRGVDIGGNLYFEEGEAIHFGLDSHMMRFFKYKRKLLLK